ncbi:hypothetical protein JCM10213_004212 [Rhodosporidiobolus nylandii]
MASSALFSTVTQPTPVAVENPAASFDLSGASLVHRTAEHAPSPIPVDSLASTSPLDALALFFRGELVPGMEAGVLDEAFVTWTALRHSPIHRPHPIFRRPSLDSISTGSDVSLTFPHDFALEPSAQEDLSSHGYVCAATSAIQPEDLRSSEERAPKKAPFSGLKGLFGPSHPRNTSPKSTKPTFLARLFRRRPVAPFSAPPSRPSSFYYDEDPFAPPEIRRVSAQTSPALSHASSFFSTSSAPSTACTSLPPSPPLPRKSFFLAC